MEFNAKLQELRKQKGLTQEEVAKALYVSRTAVSKWESGKGYPNIESLKAIAKFYNMTIDELLSGDELLTLAEEDSKQRTKHISDMVLGFLDLSVAVLFFLPLLAQRAGGAVQEVSLLGLNEVALYLKIGYFAVTLLLVLWGILTLALQNCTKSVWLKVKNIVSILLSVSGVLLFVISLQPYGATLLLVFLVIKALILAKKP